MPASGKVSMLWQIIFVLFVPIAGIWAFYRIKKLQKMILYTVLPSIGLIAMIVIPIFLMVDAFSNNPEMIGGNDNGEDWVEDGFEYDGDITVIAITIIASIGCVALEIWAIYLIVTWTEQWNKQFQ